MNATKNWSIFGAALLILATMVFPAQAVFVWNGAGVSGGNTSTVNGPVNAWSNQDNWLDGGSPAAAPPTASDDVEVTFDQTFSGGGDPALFITTGDVAQDVTIRGISSPADRRFQVTGDTSFSTLDYAKGSGNGLGIDTGVTLTLSGGSPGVPTFMTDTRSTVSVSPSYTFDGTLEANASQVYFHIDSTHGGRLLVSNPTVTADFNNRELFLGNSGIVEFVNAPTLTNPPASVSFIGNGGQFISQSGSLGDFSSTDLRADQERTAGGTVSEGTFKSVQVGTTTSSSGSPRLFMNGDLTVTGDIGNGLTAVEIVRTNRTGGVPSNNFGLLDLQGNDLTVLSTLKTVVGEVDGTVFAPGTSPYRGQRSELDMTGSTVTLAGNLEVGNNGILTGSSTTQLKIAGDFIHSSQDENGHAASIYNMDDATVSLNGTGNFFSQQLFEVQGFDFGPDSVTPTASTTGMNQYGLGSLIVGESALTPTWVRLTDDFDFEFDSLNDALYLDALTVNEGSVLVLDGKNVYVQGVLVNAFDTQYGAGQIVNIAFEGLPPVPEPTTATLLSCGLLGLALRRRKSRGPKSIS